MSDPAPAPQLLPEPVSLLDSDQAHEWTFRVTGYARGELLIQPPSEPAALLVPALRVYVPPEDKPAGPPWWDITSRQLRVALTPQLELLVERGRRVQVRAAGLRPRVTYTVTILP